MGSRWRPDIRMLFPDYPTTHILAWQVVAHGHDSALALAQFWLMQPSTSAVM